MDEIHDIHGLRLIVEKEEDCYKALRVVHQLWSKIPGKFKDYINQPKFNGYVIYISENMHKHDKEGDCKHSSFVLQMVEWARWVVTWQCETMTKDRSTICYTDSITRPPCTFPSHSEDWPYSHKLNCASDGPVFVIVMENDKMSVQEFPATSTILDLIERAGQGSFRWTSYGVSDPTCKIKMGDVVELTPVIPDKSLTEYREEIQRMYDGGLTVSTSG